MTDPRLTTWAVAQARTVGRSGADVAVPGPGHLRLAQLRTWMPGDSLIRSIAWRDTSEGGQLAFASRTLTGILDPATGEILTSMSLANSIVSWAGDLLLSANANWVILSSVEGTIGGEGYAISGQDGMTSVAYEPGQQLIATGQLDNKIVLWEHARGVNSSFQRARDLTGHRDWVTSVAWGDDRLLASGSADGTARLWSPASGSLLQILEHGAWVSALAFADLPSGRLLATVGNDGSAKVWDPATGELVHTLEGQLTKLSCAAWTVLPDGRAFLAAGGALGTVKVWDGITGKTVAETADLGGLVHSVTWGRAPDGQPMLAAAGADTGIRAFSLIAPSGPPPVDEVLLSERAVSLPKGVEPHPLPVMLPGNWVLAANGTDGIRIVSLDSGETLTLTEYGAMVEALDWQLDEAGGLFVASGDAHGHIMLWDPAAGRILMDVSTLSPGIRSVALRTVPGGEFRVAACCDSEVRSWAVADGKTLPLHLRGLEGRGLFHDVALGVSAGGRVLLAVAAGDSSVLLDDDGGQVAEVRTTESANAVDVAFGHGGQALLAVATSAGQVHIWDESKNGHVTLSVGQTPLNTLSWATLPDGRLLLAGGDNSGVVTVWDGLAGKEVARLSAGRPLLSVRWLVTPDGAVSLEAGGLDGMLVADVTLTPPVRLESPVPTRADPVLKSPADSRRGYASVDHATQALFKLGSGDLWPPLGLIGDLLQLTAGRRSGDLFDPRLQALENHPGITRLRSLGWSTPAHTAFVALLAAELEENLVFRPPEADLPAIERALTAALRTRPLPSATMAADPEKLAVAAASIDDNTAALLTLIGPETAAEEPLLVLRMRHHAASLPPLSQRELRLLAAHHRQSQRGPRRTGGTPRHTPGTAGVVRHGQLSHMLHTDLALPAKLMTLRRVENELLYRRRTAPQPPLPRPLTMVLDTTPPTYRQAEQVLRLAAHALTTASWEFGLHPILVTLGDPAEWTVLAGLHDLLHLWTTRTLTPSVSSLYKALETAAHTGRMTVLIAHQHTPGKRQLPGPMSPFVTVRHPAEPPRQHPAHPNWHQLSPEPRETELAALVNTVLLGGRST